MVDHHEIAEKSWYRVVRDLLLPHYWLLRLCQKIRRRKLMKALLRKWLHMSRLPVFFGLREPGWLVFQIIDVLCERAIRELG